jgi:hypothetical protein
VSTRELRSLNLQRREEQQKATKKRHVHKYPSTQAPSRTRTVHHIYYFTIHQYHHDMTNIFSAALQVGCTLLPSLVIQLCVWLLKPSSERGVHDVACFVPRCFLARALQFSTAHWGAHNAVIFRRLFCFPSQCELLVMA